MFYSSLRYHSGSTIHYRATVTAGCHVDPPRRRTDGRPDRQTLVRHSTVPFEATAERQSILLTSVRFVKATEQANGLMESAAEQL